MLDELTWFEVKKYLKTNDIAIMPIGTVEIMGDWPLGMEYFTPLAIARLVAERVKGIVIPHIAYTFPGATRIGVGTVNVSITESVRHVKNICRSLVEMGFRRFLLLSWHGPAPITAETAVRELFEETGVPFAYVNLEHRFPVSTRFPEEENLGALKLLGKLHLISNLPEPTEEQLEIIKEVRKNRGLGRALPKPMSRALHQVNEIGYFYTHESQHYPDTYTIIEFKKLTVEELNELADKGIEKLKERVLSLNVEELMENLKGYLTAIRKEEVTERLEKIRSSWV